MEELLKIINKYNLNPNIILDVGSRDLLESVKFKSLFKDSRVFAFECNPQTLPICRENLVDGVTLIEKAVNEFDGVCTFYPINPNKTITTWSDGNPGASSLFKSNGKYHVETYVQDEIEVECCRLDTIMLEHNINKVNLIWIDLQGAELIALKSLGNYLSGIDVIYTEAFINPMYENQCLFSDVNEYLKTDFEMVWGDLNVQFSTDVIFVNKKILNGI